MKKSTFIYIIITVVVGTGLFNPAMYCETVQYDHVSNQQPRIELNRSALYFSAVKAEAVSDPQEFVVSNSGGGTLNWIITANSNWVTYSPEFGVNSDIVTITVDPSSFPPGSYSAKLAISDLDAENSPRYVNVYLDVYSPGSTAPPTGTFASPENPAVVSGSVPLTGWAIDDVGVESVKLYRRDGPELIYFGDAVFVEGARPDVELAYPTYPDNYKAGWGYMLLTNFLPNQGNGTFTFYAIALDKEGYKTTIGTRTVTCDNANAVDPFGAIDTPAQGAVVSGTAFRNHGWVLTPMPNNIPKDGSTIEVYIDGLKVGNPVYNNYREDIAQLFPGYANSNAAHGYFDFDTAVYDTGVHTIAWIARDSAGHSAGIGSRYFTVRKTEEGRRTKDEGRGDEGRGTTGDGRPQPLYPCAGGIVNIEIRELEPLELHLPFKKVFQSVGDRLRPLPIGSTVDPERGIFYWLPGAGFCGDYEFVFINTGTEGTQKTRLTVHVKHKGVINE